MCARARHDLLLPQDNEKEASMKQEKKLRRLHQDMQETLNEKGEWAPGVASGLLV
jgi:hypothetical protein